jgi:hypothetical protein
MRCLGHFAIWMIDVAKWRNSLGDTRVWLGVARGSERICESFQSIQRNVFCRSQMARRPAPSEFGCLNFKQMKPEATTG